MSEQLKSLSNDLQSNQRLNDGGATSAEQGKFLLTSDPIDHISVSDVFGRLDANQLGQKMDRWLLQADTWISNRVGFLRPADGQTWIHNSHTNEWKPKP